MCPWEKGLPLIMEVEKSCQEDDELRLQNGNFPTSMIGFFRKRTHVRVGKNQAKMIYII